MLHVFFRKVLVLGLIVCVGLLACDVAAWLDVDYGFGLLGALVGGFTVDRLEEWCIS